MPDGAGRYLYQAILPIFWLVKEDGCTTIKRARDNEQIAAFMAEGDQMGYLWKEGFFEGVGPK